jgi:hypothetical protein
MSPLEEEPQAFNRKVRDSAKYPHRFAAIAPISPSTPAPSMIPGPSRTPIRICTPGFSATLV